MTAFSKRVSVSTDDGHEYPASTWNVGTAWMGHYGVADEIAAFRIQAVTIDPSATINSATITLTEKSTEGGSYTVNVRVYAEKIADASAPSGTNLPSAMSLTTAYTDVSILSTDWVDNQTTAINVATILQEIVNQASWVSGNDINFLIKNNGTTGNSDLSFYDYAQSTTKAAILDADWTAPVSHPVTARGQDIPGLRQIRPGRIF